MTMSQAYGYAYSNTRIRHILVNRVGIRLLDLKNLNYKPILTNPELTD